MNVWRGFRETTPTEISDMYCPVYVFMVVAGGLVPNRHQATCNHYDDTADTTVSHEYHFTHVTYEHNGIILTLLHTRCIWTQRYYINITSHTLHMNTTVSYEHYVTHVTYEHNCIIWILLHTRYIRTRQYHTNITSHTLHMNTTVSYEHYFTHVAYEHNGIIWILLHTY